MIRHTWTAVRLFVLMAILAGFIYPAIVLGISQLTMAYQANGSLVHYHGRVVGAKMIGQSFTSPKFFHGRPSAADYNAAASTASNLGPSNPALVKEVKASLALVLKQNPGLRASQVPMDLVTSSDSGLDPNISPQAAYLQVPRVARANGLPVSVVRALVTRNIHGRFLGLYGEPRLNVLELNLALVSLVKSNGS
jgi:K+-transporting ATPase ATPase C chain